jgi:outer membrane protein insertion porin family
MRARVFGAVAAWAALAAVLAAGGARGQTSPGDGRAVVREVALRGKGSLSVEEIKARIRTRPGAIFSQATLEDDVRSLYATGKLGNVQAEVRPDGEGGVRVTLVFRDGTEGVEKVTFQGAKHLDEDELNAAARVKVGAPCNPAANKAACQRIVARYNEDGRLFASCSLLKGGKPGDPEVVFQISEGPRVTVRAARFEGNDSVSAGALGRQISRSSTEMRTSQGILKPATVEADVRELEKYYRSLGFREVKVTRELEWNPDGRYATLVFHVQEGPRSRAEDAAPADLADPREPGAVLSKVKLAGHVEDKPSPETPAGDTPARIGQVIIVGNEVTPEAVILAQVGLEPGMVLSYPALRKAEEELGKIKFFEVDPARGIHPTVAVVDSDRAGPFKDVLIKVKEKPRKAGAGR